MEISRSRSHITEGGRSLVNHPSPRSQPEWILWTVYNSEVPCQFGGMETWTKRSVIEYVEEVLGVFKTDIPDVFKRVDDVYVVKIKQVDVSRKRQNLHRISITGCRKYFDEEADYFLFLDQSVGEILSPGLRVGQHLVVLGGTMDYPAYTLHLRSLIIGNNFCRSPFQILHFVPGVICPKAGYEPYGTKLSSENYQLIFSVMRKSTLLKVLPLPVYPYTRQFMSGSTSTATSSVVSSSKRGFKRPRVWVTDERVVVPDSEERTHPTMPNNFSERPKARRRHGPAAPQVPRIMKS